MTYGVGSDNPTSQNMKETLQRTTKNLARVALAVAALSGITGQAKANVGNIVGSGSTGPGIGWNSSVTDMNIRFNALRTIGLKTVRLAVDVSDLQNPTNANQFYPERLDNFVQAAYAHGLTPNLMINFYTNPDWAWYRTVDTWNWYWIGYKVAERFRPGSATNIAAGRGSSWGISIYSAFNEPNNKGFFPPDGFPSGNYVWALGNLAEGIHAVNNGLTVMNGGFLNSSPEYLSHIAPLVNSTSARRLDAIDFHHYVGNMNYGPGAGQGSAQTFYDYMMNNATVQVTRNVPVCITESSFELKDPNLNQWQAGYNNFTHYWGDIALRTKSGAINQVKMIGAWDPLVVQWNAPDWSQKYNKEAWGLSQCRQLNPWLGNERGRALRAIATMTKGMTLTSVDAAKGVYILTGGANSFAKKVWVWHNRPTWSNMVGPSFTVTGIPTGCTSGSVYGHNSMNDAGALGVYRSFPVNATSTTLTGLTDGTLVFAAK
jgi:hypothetical protein